jgi:uncharacterized protein YajQ (UPF0234 family)
MAGTASFDISTGAELQEVDNAVNQAVKEIGQRYDFKGSQITLEFDRGTAEIRLHADDEFRMKQVLDILLQKCAKRGVPLQNLKTGELVPGAGTSVRCTVTLTQGIPQDTAKQIQKSVKEQGFKKVQVSIQGDELRVSSPSKDELQSVIAFLRSQDFGLQLKFGNYRG